MELYSHTKTKIEPLIRLRHSNSSVKVLVLSNICTLKILCIGISRYYSFNSALKYSIGQFGEY